MPFRARMPAPAAVAAVAQSVHASAAAIAESWWARTSTPPTVVSCGACTAASATVILVPIHVRASVCTVHSSFWAGAPSPHAPCSTRACPTARATVAGVVVEIDTRTPARHQPCAARAVAHAIRTNSPPHTRLTARTAVDCIRHHIRAPPATVHLPQRTYAVSAHTHLIAATDPTARPAVRWVGLQVHARAVAQRSTLRTR